MDNFNFTDIERQRRILRVVLFVIIVGTLPFYCAGFLLLGTSGQVRQRDTTPLPTSTLFQNARPTLTPFPTLRLAVTVTQLSPLRPTPRQFNPGIPIVPTSPPIIIVPPTQVIIPTNTFAPTLTPFPTQVPPTEPPPATWTPLPTEVPPTAEPPTAEPPTAEPPTAEPPTAEPLPTEAMAPAEPPPGS